MSNIIVWTIFLGLAAIAVAMAACMILTMSMYRAGLVLMTSFISVAGLFLLLGADLLAAIQIMMNVGGMMVMILFMVMIMMDPGGEMMWEMKRSMAMPGLAALSMSMPRGAAPEEPDDSAHSASPSDVAGDYTCPMHPEVRQSEPGECPKCGMELIPASKSVAPAGDYTCPMHPEVRQSEPGDCPKCGMELVPASKSVEPDGEHQKAGAAMEMAPQQHHQMMVDMAMSTAQLPWALALGALAAVVLAVFVIMTPWPRTAAAPSRDATTAVGELLLSNYMIAFEGAAFLILSGMVGAVIFGRRESFQRSMSREPVARPSTVIYTCPMHPRVRQSAPGECPICGMDLVPATAGSMP